VLSSFGTCQYVIFADEGIPADIAGPATGLHFLVPPLWYSLYERKCMGVRTALGFMLSLVSLILFSGLLSESISYTISSREWLALAMVTLG